MNSPSRDLLEYFRRRTENRHSSYEISIPPESDYDLLNSFHLLGKKADLEESDYYGRTPLHSASNCGFLEVVQYLVGQGVDFEKCDDKGITPLHEASFNGRLDVVRYLVGEGADLERSDKDGMTSLHKASYRGHLDVVQYLVGKGVQIEAGDDGGITALHKASCNGHLDVVHYLVSQGADLERADYEGCTSLHKASYNGRLAVVRYLVSEGAYLDKGDTKGSTPLQKASCNGHLEVVRFLVGKGAKIEKSDNNGSTPLHKASYNGHLRVVRHLVSEEADLRGRDGQGGTPLLYASFKGHLHVVQFLVSKGAQLELCNNMGSTPLYKALYQRHLNVAQYLVSKGAQIENGDKKGITALQKAAYKGHLDVVQFLVSKGSCLDKGDNDGRTPLHHAAYNDHLEIAKLFVSKGAQLEKRDNNGRTPLHYASYHGHLNVTQYLIDQGALINDADKDGSTPLHKASYNGHLNVVQYLVGKGAALETVDIEDGTPLQCASYNGHLNVVQYLISEAADLEKVDIEGHTSLHKASYNGHLDVVQCLVSEGADTEKSCKDGRTPVYYASSTGHVDVVQYLNSNRAQFLQDEQKRKSANLPVLGTQTVAEPGDTTSKTADELERLRLEQSLSFSSTRNGSERNSLKQRQSTESREESHVVRIENHHIEVRIPPSEPYSSRDVTVEAITDVPPDLVLKESEVLISAGLKMSPSELQFTNPIKVTMNHSAIFSNPGKAQIVLYTRRNSTEKFSVIPSTTTGVPRCVVRDRDLDLYIDHFSEWWIVAYIRWYFIGKRVICTPYTPISITRNAKYVLYLSIADDNNGNPKDITGYKIAFPKTQFYMKWRYGGLIVTYYMDGVAIKNKTISEETFHYLTDQTESFDLDMKETAGDDGVFIKYTLKQSIEKEIYFKINIEDPQDRCHVIRVSEENQPITIGRTDSDGSEPRPDKIHSSPDPSSTLGAVARRCLEDEEDVSDTQILKLSRHLEPRQFRDIQVGLGIGYATAEGIKQRTTESSEQYFHLLQSWKSQSRSTRVKDLKDALVGAKAGGLVNRL